MDDKQNTGGNQQNTGGNQGQSNGPSGSNLDDARIVPTKLVKGGLDGPKVKEQLRKTNQ